MNKWNKAIPLPLLGSVFLLFLLNNWGMGQSAAAGKNEEKNLTGHAVTIEKMARLCDDIVLAKFIAIGYPSGDANGQDYYEQAKIEIDSTLKGSLSGTITVGYDVLNVPGTDRETVPTPGESYIAFIRENGPIERRILKLLPATDVNVAEVKKVLGNSASH